MKRPAFICVVVLLALAVTPVSPSAAATNEVKFCQVLHGWQIAAGNQSPQFPRTRCSFARATYRRVSMRPGRLVDLPRRFRVRVRGVSLGCRAKHDRDTAQFRCRSPRRFVLAYRFR
jgi:hypothetical protein